MPFYNFECKVCERKTAFLMKMDDVPKVGESFGLSAAIVPDQNFICDCGANNWSRMFELKAPAFKMNMRRTSVL